MKSIKFSNLRTFEALLFLGIFFSIFGYIVHVMGTPNMLNTMMNTAYKLLIDTVLYIMAITVVSTHLKVHQIRI